MSVLGVLMFLGVGNREFKQRHSAIQNNKISTLGIVYFKII